MEHKALKDLFVGDLRDLYDAENRLVKALPKIAQASRSPELRDAFDAHLGQTREHVDRLKEIFKSLGEKPKGKKCAGMMGLLKEGDKVIAEHFEGDVKDAALISAAQRVEHYEIAAYGCVSTWAELLGRTDATSLLEQTLQEEKEADHKLTQLALKINAEAKAATAPEAGESKEEVLAEETAAKAAKGAGA
jgi:ferritin-like metal-binding protein YciE